MLRLRPSLRLNLSVRKQSINSLARRLIPVTGDFESAQREAKWLREDCQKTAAGPEQESLLEQYVSRRSKGEPLQYILGSTYFNDLEIKCRPGVFIPRPETAASVSYLVSLLVQRVEHNFEIQAQEQAEAEAESPSDDDVSARSATKTTKRTKLSQKGRRAKQDKKPKQVRVKRHFKVFDLCTGTGCIPLGFWHEWYSKASKRVRESTSLELAGFDVSTEALDLARKNHALIQASHVAQDSKDWRAGRSLRRMKFHQANILHRSSSTAELAALPTLRQALRQQAQIKLGKITARAILEEVKTNGIWISNPPYISQEHYANDATAASVRDYEPKLALVPPDTLSSQAKERVKTGHDADRFYQDILEQAIELRAQLILFEVADMSQAKRVVGLAAEQENWHLFQIWRDNPSDNSEEEEPLAMHERLVTIHGSGNGRSVLIATREGARWVGMETEVEDMRATRSVRREILAAQREEKRLEMVEREVAGEERRRARDEKKQAVKEMREAMREKRKALKEERMVAHSGAGRTKTFVDEKEKKAVSPLRAAEKEKKDIGVSREETSKTGKSLRLARKDNIKRRKRAVKEKMVAVHSRVGETEKIVEEKRSAASAKRAVGRRARMVGARREDNRKTGKYLRLAQKQEIRQRKKAVEEKTRAVEAKTRTVEEKVKTVGEKEEAFWAARAARKANAELKKPAGVPMAERFRKARIVEAKRHRKKIRRIEIELLQRKPWQMNGPNIRRARVPGVLVQTESGPVYETSKRLRPHDRRRFTPRLPTLIKAADQRRVGWRGVEGKDSQS